MQQPSGRFSGRCAPDTGPSRRPATRMGPSPPDRFHDVLPPDLQRRIHAHALGLWLNERRAAWDIYDHSPMLKGAEQLTCRLKRLCALLDVQ